MSIDSKMKKAEDIKEFIDSLVDLAKNKDVPVYIGDPNIIVKKLLKKMLEEKGFSNVQLAINPDHVVQLAKSKKEEFVLFYNLNTNGFDGIRMLKTLQEIERLNPIHFIMITNEMRNAELQAIRNLGAESYLIKPIESKGLDEALEMCDLL